MRSVQRPSSGFTLLELMIAVAVIGILAAIALPSYQDSVRKGRRGDAQGFLQEVAARQQQFLVDRRAYSSSITDALSAGGLALTVPSNVSNFYTVALTTDNTTAPPSYTLTATPSGGQTKDSCGTLTLTSTGAKSASGTGTCW